MPMSIRMMYLYHISYDVPVLYQAKMYQIYLNCPAVVTLLWQTCMACLRLPYHQPALYHSYVKQHFGFVCNIFQ